MSKMARDLSEKDRKEYLDAARKREERRKKELAHRTDRAQSLAYRAADILRQKYTVQRVVLFGSLTDPSMFTPWSDVDIAAWGLRSENFLKAMNDVASLDPEIEINLVDINTVQDSLLENILSQGKDI